MALPWLKETAVRDYLEYRFPGATLPRHFVQLVHQRTDGNPLFMVNVADHLVERGVLGQQDSQWVLTREQDASEMGLPATLRQGIEAQIARLPARQQALLEVASVAGIEFSTATVAAGLLEEQETVEQYCEQLARQGRFLRVKGLASWPDGSTATQYEFLHALYQETFYERIAVGRRVLFHQRIGVRLEAGYGEETSAIAAELAMHFERGRDYRRAVQYLGQAAEKVIQRSAHQEAISLLTKGLTLLSTLPDTPARAQQELRLQLALGASLMAIKGYTAPEVEQTYSRARVLSRQLGESQQFFSVLAGLCGFYLLSGALHTAYEFGEQLLALAQQEEHPALLAEAHRMLGAALFWQGESVRARGHFEHGIAIYDPQKHRSHSFHFVINTGVACRAYAAWALCLLGYPEQALERSQEALALARDLKDHHGLAFALSIASQVHKLRSEEDTASERADEVIALSSEREFAQFLAIGKLFRGRISGEGQQSEEEGVQMRQEMVALQARGMKLVQPVFLTLQAEACQRSGQAEEGLNLVTTALAAVDENGERMYEAELHRLRGQLVLQSGVQSPTSKSQANQKSKACPERSRRSKNQKSEITDPRSLTPDPQGEAEACFHKAIDIAKRQQAKSLELRATISLARLWRSQSKHHAARNMLSEIYHWFTEGFDTKDLREAKALLEELK
jgi:predicted ATPase